MFPMKKALIRYLRLKILDSRQALHATWFTMYFGILLDSLET